MSYPSTEEGPRSPTMQLVPKSGLTSDQPNAPAHASAPTYYPALPVHPSQRPGLPRFAGDYVAVPPPMYEAQAFRRDLCGCFDDMEVCCMAFWCPCILVGKNANMRAGNHPDFNYCNTPAMVNFFLRLIPYVGTALGTSHSSWQRCLNRDSLRISQSYTKDCLTSFCCPFCALTQEHLELRDRYNAAYQAQQGGPPQQQM